MSTTRSSAYLRQLKAADVAKLLLTDKRRAIRSMAVAFFFQYSSFFEDEAERQDI